MNSARLRANPASISIPAAAGGPELAREEPRTQSWALWRAQIRAILRLELKKTLFARRGFWIYLLAFAPVVLYAGHSFYEIKTGHAGDIGEDTHIFAAVFQFFFLRLSIFFGCVGIFMNLFRGEVMEKSLHYYFLAPVRRSVLVAGKFLSGMLAASLIYCTSTALQFIAVYWHFSSTISQEYFYHGHGLDHLAAYLGVTLLACLGYGSVFLAAGVLFRNPLIPTLVVLLWEAISGFLPPLLQKFSVIFYLKSLCPVSVPPEISLDRGNPLALIAANPTPASVVTAVLGLIMLSAAVLVFSSLKVRRMEIDYGTE
jgi:ABC-type transport system involved in multi-copper enzyme maturation permease subunit